MSDNNAIVHIENLEFSYGSFSAVRGISFDISEGEVFGLLGTNGAGKTTTLEMIEGFRKPSSGKIRVFGKDPFKEAEEVRKHTGVVLQEAGFFLELNVKSTLSWWGNISGRIDNVDRLLARCHLFHKKNELVESLSGGERRRLDLAMALWGNPELLILDEPTTGLDPESRRHLWDIIDEQREIGSSILLTTHYLEEAEYLCDRLVIMNEGKSVVEGTLDELRDSSKVTGYIDITRNEREFSSVDVGSDFFVSEEGKELRLSFTDIPVEKALETVLSLESNFSGQINSLSIRPRTLEELFIEIAENSNKDTAKK